MINLAEAVDLVMTKAKHKYIADPESCEESIYWGARDIYFISAKNSPAEIACENWMAHGSALARAMKLRRFYDIK